MRVKGRHEVVALLLGPKDERVDGYGPSPQDALSTLANRLRDVKG